MVKAKLHFDGQSLDDVQLDLVTFKFSDRIKRSLKVFVLFFGLAVFSILLPILHFVLVPTFLILSVVLSIRKVREIKLVSLESLQCPLCHGKFDTKKRGLKPGIHSLRLQCHECRKSLSVVLES